MPLFERIKQDLARALKGGSSGEAGTLRYLLAELHNREIEKRGKGGAAELTEEDVAGVLRREVKKRREAIELFRRGGREDLVRREEGELAILSAYLPPELGREAIEAVIDELMGSGLKDFASLMRGAMKQLKGKADGRIVGDIIKSKLED